MSSGFDARRFKAMERAGFNRIAGRYADGAHLRAELATALIDAAALAPGQRVLDLASGPGLLALEAAGRVSPNGLVLATDIAEGMLAEGARRIDGSGIEDRGLGDRGVGDEGVADKGVDLLFAAADAEHLCLPDASIDRVLAGLALFMFPHPDRALAEIHRVLVPGGQVALSVWGVRDTVPLISRAQDCIARLLPPPKVPRPSVFRYGDAGVLEAMLVDAGFGQVRITPCDFSCCFDSAEDYWQAFLDLAGGAAEALSRLPEPTRLALQAAVSADLEAHPRSDGKPGFCVPARALVASAVRSG